jgi:hypothetical protein
MAQVHCTILTPSSSARGQSRGFHDVRNESGLPPTPDVSLHGNERSKRANAQSRCAPARCAGARAERLVTDREDSDSGVAKSTRSTSALFGVQRMIKHIEMICGPAPG